MRVLAASVIGASHFRLSGMMELPYPLDEKELPLELPYVEKYGPGTEGEGPLSNLTDWVNAPNGKRETSTMPGYAGISLVFSSLYGPA